MNASWWYEWQWLTDTVEKKIDLGTDDMVIGQTTS